MGEEDSGAPDFRRASFRLFDLACRLTGLNNSELAATVGQAIGRPGLTRQTISNWREGRAAVPHMAALVVFYLLDSDEEALNFIDASRRRELGQPPPP